MESETISPYNPTQEEKEYIENAYNEFQYCVQLKNEPWKELNNLSVVEYLKRSRQRALGYLPFREDDGLSNYTTGKPRNKRNVIAAFVAAQRPRIDLYVRNKGEKYRKTDKKLSQVMYDDYNYIMDVDDGDSKFLDFTTETLDVGIGAMMTKYNYYVREVKELVKYDFATGKGEYKTVTRIEKDSASADVVPIEDIFVPDMYQQDEQEQPYIYIREYILRSVASIKYKDFPNWKHVPSKSFLAGNEKESDTFFFNQWDERTEDPFVEILHRYHKDNDEYAIIANGVMLTDVGQPFIFDHKEYPITTARYEKIGKFWIGLSLPMKIADLTDVYDELTNINTDRSRMSSMVKFAGNYDGELESDSIGAFEIIKIDAETGLQELKIDSVKPGDNEFRRSLGEEIDEATVNKSFGGTIEGVTAAEIQNARAQSIQSLGLVMIDLYKAVKRYSLQLLANDLQFKFGVGLKEYKNFDTKEIILNTRLNDGKDGTRIIRIISDDKKRPTNDEINEEKEKGVNKTIDSVTGKEIRQVETNYDIIYVTPQELSNLELFLTVVPGSSLPETESLKKALILELDNVLFGNPMFAQLTDPEKAYDETVETFGYIADDFKKDMTQQPAAQAAGGNPLEALLGGAGGGGAVPSQNSELVQQMAGTQSPSAQDLLAQPL